VSNAIADSARARGAQIRTNAVVKNILVKNGRASGVVLENGEEVAYDRLLLATGAEPLRLPLPQLPLLGFPPLPGLPVSVSGFSSVFVAGLPLPSGSVFGPLPGSSLE